MTTTDLAAALIKDVPKDALAQIIYEAMRFERQTDTPDWVDGGNSAAQAEARHAAAKVQDAVLAALTAALEGVDERAGALVSQISVQQLPDEMDEDDLEAADFEAGYIGVLVLARNAADLITALSVQNAALRAERDDFRSCLATTSGKLMVAETALAALEPAAHVNETLKSEHEETDVLTEYTLAPHLQKIVDGAKTTPQWDTQADRLAPTEAAHVNETPKSEHDGADVLTAAQAREAALHPDDMLPEAIRLIRQEATRDHSQEVVTGLKHIALLLDQLIGEARDD